MKPEQTLHHNLVNIERGKLEMLTIGQTASFAKTVTEADISAFAGITGDFNSIHINEQEAQKSVFGRRVAHGMLSASFISTVIGMYLPGKGTIYLSQNLQFVSPVFVGDTITAQVTVIELINEKKGIYKLKTQCINQAGTPVIDGEAVVKYTN